MAGEKAIGICTNEFSSDNPSRSRATKIVDQASPKASNRYANTPLVFVVIGRSFLSRRSGAERQELAVACQNQPQVATQQLVAGPRQDGEDGGEHQGRREAPQGRHLSPPESPITIPRTPKVLKTPRTGVATARSPAREVSSASKGTTKRLSRPVPETKAEERTKRATDLSAPSGGTRRW